MKKLLLKSLLAFAVLGIANVSNGQTVLLNEDFSSGSMPAGWSQDSAGVAPYWPWSFNDPGTRYPLTTYGAGFDANFAIFDSDHDGNGNSQDAYLNAPSVNASALSTVYLVMDEQYRDYTNGYHQIEISTDGGTSWTGILSDTDITSVGYPSPASHSIYDITTYAAGQSDVRVRFHYGAATWAWWWAIDNVKIVDALPSPPANDDCANAIMLTEGATCTTTSFTLEAATSSGGLGCNGAVADDDVWFSFVATDVSCIVKLASTGLNHTVEVFDGCGGTSIACLSPGLAGFTSLVSGLTIGNTYYLAVYTDVAATHDVSNIDICLMTPPPPPANDDCSGAVLLTVGATCTPTSGTLSGATDSGIAGCTGTADDDVWYSFVANDTAIAITVNGHGQNDPVIEVFDACGGLSIGCLNDFFGPYEKSLARSLTIGNTYYFRIYSLGASLLDSSDFDVCLTNVVFPANDNCANATLINSVASEDLCDLSTLVVTDLSTPSAEPISCSSSNYFDDVWYYFVATSATMTANTYNHSPGVLSAGGVGFALYDGCGGTELFCQNPPIGGVMYSFTGLTVGNTYYLRTFTASGLTAGSWNLCLFDGLFTAVKEEPAVNGLQLFPDPTNGLLNIAVEKNSGKSTIKVVDILGNLMKEEVIQNISKTTLDLTAFANGIYFVKVENEKGNYTQKIILSK